MRTRSKNQKQEQTKQKKIFYHNEDDNDDSVQEVSNEEVEEEHAAAKPLKFHKNFRVQSTLDAYKAMGYNIKHNEEEEAAAIKALEQEIPVYLQFH